MKFPAPTLLLAASLCLLPRLPAQVAPQSGADATSAQQPGTDATTARAPAPQMYGKVEGDYYTSPIGFYKVRVPVLPQLGGSISDTPNVVTFDDDFSTHISIGAFPFSRELKWEYDTRGAKDFLVYFFTNLVMPDFAARFPNSKMEDNAAFLPKFQDGSLLIFTPSRRSASKYRPNSASWLRSSSSRRYMQPPRVRQKSTAPSRIGISQPGGHRHCPRLRWAGASSGFNSSAPAEAG